MQVAQRLDAQPRDLPALARHERGAPGLGHLEVGRAAAQPVDRVAFLPEGILHRVGEVAPGHRANRLERVGDPLGARRPELSPPGDDTDHDERRCGKDRVGDGDRRKDGLRQRGDPGGDDEADPPLRAQENRKQRILGHPEFHGGRFLLAYRYMLRRYCPPTSNSACVICPSEQTRTASISTSNTFRFSITACCSRFSIAGEAPAFPPWNSARRLSCDCFSSSVDRISSIFSGTGSPCGFLKVFTPTIGYEPSCFWCS